jgi:hypothetical protein
MKIFTVDEVDVVKGTAYKVKKLFVTMLKDAEFQLYTSDLRTGFAVLCVRVIFFVSLTVC